jgi:sugar/nucleoside kinase (ribokinase family)
MYRPYSVEVINDNGAGDAFFAGFIAGKWHGKSEQESIYYGLAAAARVVRCPEAVDDDLDFEELSSYISTHETRD